VGHRSDAYYNKPFCPTTEKSKTLGKPVIMNISDNSLAFGARAQQLWKNSGKGNFI
jgi:hypothetical protein